MAEKDNIHKNHRQRMRAKFSETGFKGWSDYEILEYMLYNVYRQGDTNPIAHRIMEYSGNSIVNVMRNARDLRMANDVNNVGETAVLFLRSLKEFIDYYKIRELKFEPQQLNRYNFRDIINVVGFEPDREDILMICADTFMNVKCIANISEQSSTTYAFTSAEKIIKTATMNGASYVLILHNHPNGVPEISEDDEKMTLYVDNLLNSVGIILIDHMVICGKRILSIKENIIRREMKARQESNPEDGAFNYE